MRQGPWKLHLKTINPASGDEQPKVHDPPLLFHLGRDPSERVNVAAQHPAVIEQILKDVEKHRQDVKPGNPQHKAGRFSRLALRAPSHEGKELGGGGTDFKGRRVCLD